MKLAGSKREGGIVAVNTGYAVTLADHQRVLNVTASGSPVEVSIPVAGTLPEGFFCVIRRAPASDANVTLSGGVSRTLTGSGEAVIVEAGEASYIDYPTQGQPGEQGLPGADGVDGVDGADGAAGPNEVTTSTATNITGLLKGNGSFVGAAAAGDLPAHASGHAAGGGDSLKLDDLAAPDDNTDLDVSTAKHGLCPKAPNDTSKALLGDGTWGTPAGGSTDDPGTMKMTACAAAPTGWLLCDGSAVSRTTFADLFSAIGTTYGAGDGSTTFNVPDLRGRVPVGVGTGTGGGASGTGAPTGGSALTAVSRATWKGAETHTLTTAELASHDHGLSPPIYNITAGTAATGTSRNWLTLTNTGHANLSNSATAGSGNAHNNIQPVMGVNFIIKT